MTLVELIVFAYFRVVPATLYTTLFQVDATVLLILGLFFCIEKNREQKKSFREFMKEHPWALLLLCMLLWAIICTCLSENPLQSLLGTERRFDGLISYFLYGGILLSAMQIEGRETKLKLLRLFPVAAIPVAVIVVLQVFDVPLVSYVFSYQAAVFDHFNHTGYYFNMAIVIAAGLSVFDGDTKKKRILYGTEMGVLLYGLLANDTFGGYFAAALAILIALPLFWLKRETEPAKRRRILLPIGILAGLSFLSCLGFLPGTALAGDLTVFGNDLVKIALNKKDKYTAGTNRLYMWNEAMKEIFRKPIFGHGPEGIYGTEYAKRLNNDRSANEYIQWALFLGIPGFLMYAGSLVFLAIDRFKKLKALSPAAVIAGGMVVAYLISACFGNTMYYTVCYLWMAIGLLAGGSLTKEQ